MSADTSNPVDARIRELVGSSKIFLFMKGSRNFPQCGFSGAVVGVLDELGIPYETCDVIKDPEIRQGIKTFSDWPTIPQLYIDQEFVGGSDIIRQMHAKGELHKMLGVKVEEVEPPTITVTDNAKAAIEQAMEGETGVLRVMISPSFQYQMGFGPAEDGGFAVESNGVTVHIDRGSAKRANGMTLDFQDGPSGGVMIDNPNEPAKVQQMSVTDLKAAMDAGEPVALYDVRTDEERELAAIAGATHLTPETVGDLMALPKDTRLVFLCHHGSRSQAAAQEFVSEGFKNVHNLVGGIDAWSAQVDNSVPRY
jgi:monothiol glutaredoxin